MVARRRKVALGKIVVVYRERSGKGSRFKMQRGLEGGRERERQRQRHRDTETETERDRDSEREREKREKERERR